MPPSRVNARHRASAGRRLFQCKQAKRVVSRRSRAAIFPASGRSQEEKTVKRQWCLQFRVRRLPSAKAMTAMSVTSKATLIMLTGAAFGGGAGWLPRCFCWGLVLVHFIRAF
jgi:hypothetical protein